MRGREKILVGGVDGATGKYALPPITEFEVAERVRGALPFTPAESREHRWWVERYGLADRTRALAVGVDPKSLAEAGWGVLFSPRVAPEVREALKPLLELRLIQADRLYKEFWYQPGMSKEDFLALYRAFPGPANPRYIPYYLLIVGDPEAIPFHFQYDLDIQYAVGRIWFDRPEDYAHYAESVVRAETRPLARSRQLVFFGVGNPQDAATQHLSDELIYPLAERLTEKQDWGVRLVRGPEATKGALERLLGGNETPALLFTASHGIGFPPGHPRQLLDQGALLCSDWPGPRDWEGPIPSNFYFSADDIRDEADFHGLVAFLYSDFSGGTPERDDFFERFVVGKPVRAAPYPFIAQLPQRLLSHPRGGALAVVTQVDRIWSTSFIGTGRSLIQVFESALRVLLKGFPVGFAMEYSNQRYAELAVELASLWEDEGSRMRLAELWVAAHDARNLVVFGDPAVRLTSDVEPAT